MERILTIGVYGWSLEAWLAAIAAAAGDAIVDIRARRGVRGAEFVWANRQRLEAALAGAAIDYLYRPQLAPTPEIRAVQTAADAASRTGKRDRTQLTATFADRYARGVADRVDWRELADGIHAARPVLLCVERTPAACHRSIAAERLSAAIGVPVTHLVPS